MKADENYADCIYCGGQVKEQRLLREIHWKTVVVLLVVIQLALRQVICSSAGGEDRAGDVPDWVRTGEAVKASEIPEADYPYLAGWLEEHAKPAGEYLISLFERHQLVIFGESHNVKEHKDFIIELLPRLYHEAGVRCVGWEFSRYGDNDRLAQLVAGKEFDKEGVLAFARDQVAHEWNSKEHWGIIEAVWRLNHRLAPGDEKLRLIGLNMDADLAEFFVVFKAKPPESPEFQEMLSRALECDKVMAEHIQKEIIEKGKNGLVFVGRCHDFTHHEFPPDVNFGREIMGNLLYKRNGDRIFQVWPSPGTGIIERVMTLSGNADRTIGFDLPPGIRFSHLARGYVYLGPKAKLHKNTPIKGFVAFPPAPHVSHVRQSHSQAFKMFSIEGGYFRSVSPACARRNVGIGKFRAAPPCQRNRLFHQNIIKQLQTRRGGDRGQYIEDLLPRLTVGRAQGPCDLKQNRRSADQGDLAGSPFAEEISSLPVLPFMVGREEAQEDIRIGENRPHEPAPLACAETASSRLFCSCSVGRAFPRKPANSNSSCAGFMMIASSPISTRTRPCGLMFNFRRMDAGRVICPFVEIVDSGISWHLRLPLQIIPGKAYPVKGAIWNTTKLIARSKPFVWEKG